MEWVDRYVNFLLMRSKTFNNQCAHPIETNQVIWSANQLTGFYMMGRLVVKGLNMCNVCPEAVVRRCSVKTVFFKIPQNFTGKHLCQSLFFNKVAGLWSATLLKKWLWHRCFPDFLTNGKNKNFRIQTKFFRSIRKISSKHFNVGSTLLLGWYDVATSHNVKSTLKQRYVRQRWNLQRSTTLKQRCVFPHWIEQR